MAEHTDSNDRDAEIDRIADAFEIDWKRGARPSLTQFIAQIRPQWQQELLLELIALDVDYQKKNEQTPKLADYTSQFPELLLQRDGSPTPRLLLFFHQAGPLDSPRLQHSHSPATTGVVAVGSEHFGQGDKLSPTATVPGVPRISGYEIIRLLGAGGMGTVWEAVQKSTNRRVALKLMHPSFFRRPKALARFEREVELAAQLEHDGIARIYESGLDHDQYYFAMEYVPGRSLDDFVAQEKLSRRQILRLLQTIAEAVQYAHQRGVIHRDLKPANISVTSEGKPKLLDFGLAKSIDGSGSHPAVSLAGEVVGTAAYMSPEQARGEATKVDTRTDVYSLGAMLFELLAGQLAHRMDGDLPAVLRRIGEEEPLRLCSVLPTMDFELDVLVAKALAVAPADRYASAGELAADIGRYLAGEPLLARPQTMIYFLRKRLRKYRWHVMSAAAALVGVVVGTVFYIRNIDDARQKAESARIAAVQQKEVAQLNELRANEQRALALRTVNDLVFAIQRELKRDSRQAPLREKILGIAMQDLDRFAEDVQQSGIRGDRPLAAALLQIGDLRREAGRLPEAESAYGESLKRFRLLLAEKPQDYTAQHDLLVALARCAKLKTMTGAASSAIALLNEARGLLGILAPTSAKATLTEDELAIELAFGDAATELQRAPDAVAAYEKCLKILQTANAAQVVPDQAIDSQRAGILRRLASAELLATTSSNDAIDRAKSHARQAVTLSRAANKASLDDFQANATMASSLVILAQACLAGNEVGSAQTVLDEARQLLPTTPKANLDSGLLLTQAWMAYLSSEVATRQRRMDDTSAYLTQARQSLAGCTGPMCYSQRRLQELLATATTRP